VFLLRGGVGGFRNGSDDDSGYEDDVWLVDSVAFSWERILIALLSLAGDKLIELGLRSF
jgi:hypothetical protein